MLKEQIKKDFPGLERMLDAMSGLGSQFSSRLEKMSRNELDMLYMVLLRHNERMELGEG